MKKFDLDEVKTFIANEGPASKIYLGVDSISYKKQGAWWADYYKVIVVHKNGCNGCKIFGEVETERDYIINRKKPTFRLMNEVYRASSLYLSLADVIGDRDAEIHLDLNPDPKFVSSLVIDQAIGFIKGTCNITPIVKPDSFAATHCADRLLRVKVA